MVLASGAAAAQGPDEGDAKTGAVPAGTYRAWLDSPGGELPFGLKLEWDAGARTPGETPGEKGAWRASLLNGPESIPVPRVVIDGRRLVLEILHYDSRIEAELLADGQSLKGEWTKRASGKDRRCGLPFHARLGELHRFSPATDRGAPSVLAQRPARFSVPARFRVKFASSPEPAVLELKDSGGQLQGTFLTTTGDYRFLAGRWEEDGHFRLSCFDGAHAFLFHAGRIPGETLCFEGDFWSRDSWHEKWTASYDPDARLPDAFALTRFDESVDLGALSYPDLGGKLRRLDDEAFAGTARLIYVFGSWCPNCHDCTEYLVELHRRYSARGLRILGLAFELTGDFERDAEQLRRYRERHGVPWPLLLAGPSDKGRATEAFPALDRIRSYPTTIFLDSENRVRAVHQGFTGPATGDAYRELRRQFEAHIEKMLSAGR